MDEDYKADKEQLYQLYKYSQERVHHSTKIRKHLEKYHDAGIYAFEQGGSVNNQASAQVDTEDPAETRGWISWQEELNELKLHEKSLQRQIDFMFQYLLNR